jgi:hypothetical protein
MGPKGYRNAGRSQNVQGCASELGFYLPSSSVHCGTCAEGAGEPLPLYSWYHTLIPKYLLSGMKQHRVEETNR